MPRTHDSDIPEPIRWLEKALKGAPKDRRGRLMHEGLTTTLRAYVQRWQAAGLDVTTNYTGNQVSWISARTIAFVCAATLKVPPSEASIQKTLRELRESGQIPKVRGPSRQCYECNDRGFVYGIGNRKVACTCDRGEFFERGPGWARVGVGGGTKWVRIGDDERGA